ncbi:hypothetical protein IWX78_000731 [Mycetocola sp. CAN_C7]|uniref:hypothetical protein n=1 Tax=Mycetocola sp. CAN_C7 TaxID=2787724 RepID=UPI0018CABB98
MDVSHRNIHSALRLLLASLGLALVWLVLSFVVGTGSAHAEGRDSRSPAGGVVSDAVGTGVVNKVVRPVVEPVADVAPAPVTKVLPAVTSTVSAVVDAKPVNSIVTPVAEVVDEVVVKTASSVPMVKDLPVVPDILGDSPVGDITGPITGVVDDVLIDVGGIDVGSETGSDSELPAVPDLPGLPGGILDPAPSDADVVGSDTAAIAPVFSLDTMMSSWAATSSVRADGSSAASAQPHPDPVPRGPADNGFSVPPSPSGTSTGAASAGSAGSAVAAWNSSVGVPALLAGALLSHAENDALPSAWVRDLSSTPD